MGRQTLSRRAVPAALRIDGSQTVSRSPEGTSREKGNGGPIPPGSLRQLSPAVAARRGHPERRVLHAKLRALK